MWLRRPAIHATHLQTEQAGKLRQRALQRVRLSSANVLVSGRPPRWLIVARCFRPVRSTCSWATAYASALVQRAETIRAETKRWCNEVRPACADEGVGAPAEATVFESSLLRGRERWSPEPSAAAALRRTKLPERRGTTVRKWTVLKRSHCPVNQ